ncbi:MAG: thiamine pyrophosphate-dependent dehydrogenase E1 component subunit alpha [Oscillospiraceae bacterium]|nr:thiamine pyrophosphate-dependent dehydrogenase E1 component subunit alpha [Oscillospiraceae bacterium]
MDINRDIATTMYLRMKRIREFENTATTLFSEGKIPGALHLYSGEEAIAAGVCANLHEDDYIVSTHRGHGHIVAKGGELRYMMAELLGKETGYCNGKGGSMHIADVSKGILGANGIVGAGLSISVGAGLSISYCGTDQLCVCFFGDGSTNQGTFHEALNLAGIWKLPIIFVCENNFYGASMSQAKHMAIRNIADRGAAYGIPGVVADGNDVIAVYNTTAEAASRARRGDGPTLIECKTYRHRGQFEGDPGIYRPAAEVEEWLTKDPLPRFSGFLQENGLLSAQEIAAIDNQVADEIAEAIIFAEQSPYPAVERTVEDIYSDIIEEVRIR